MKTFYNLFGSLLIFTVLVSCGETQKKETEADVFQTNKNKIDSLYDKVMEEHDVAMPKMGRLMRLKKEIGERIDSLGNEGEEILELKEIKEDLENADKEMMQWMRDFEQQQLDSTNFETVKEYYKNQQEAIADVHDEMKKAMNEADSLLSN